MNQITVEFFHDVICSFCFPMSYRMRQLQEKMPQVKIVHRSFALVSSENDFERMFGSRDAAKGEILSHWAQANQNDDLHRFQIEPMSKADFPFPMSINPLTACEAARLIGGNEGYWDLFDALQSALFTKAQNVESLEVIEECVHKCGLDFDMWKKSYESDDATYALEDDISMGRGYGIQSVPCLVVESKQKISGALPLDQLMELITSASDISHTDGGACRPGDHGMDCN